MVNVHKPCESTIVNTTARVKLELCFNRMKQVEDWPCSDFSPSNLPAPDPGDLARNGRNARATQRNCQSKALTATARCSIGHDPDVIFESHSCKDDLASVKLTHSEQLKRKVPAEGIYHERLDGY